MKKNIFENLRKDHDVQRNLLNKLVETQGDSLQRDALFKAVKDELTDHAKAEERAFYNPLIKDDLTIEKTRHSIAEHHEIDEIIEDLEKLEYSSSAWLKRAKDLQEKVNHHLDEEEHEVFQLAGKALNEKQKIQLGSAYAEQMEELRHG